MGQVFEEGSTYTKQSLPKVSRSIYRSQHQSSVTSAAHSVSLCQIAVLVSHGPNLEHILEDPDGLLINLTTPLERQGK